MAKTFKTNLQYSAQTGQLIGAIKRVERAQDTASKKMVADVEKVNRSLKRQERQQAKLGRKVDKLGDGARKAFEQMGGGAGALGSGMVELGGAMGVAAVAAGALGSILFEAAIPAAEELLELTVDQGTSLRILRHRLDDAAASNLDLAKELERTNDLTRREALAHVESARFVHEHAEAWRGLISETTGFEFPEPDPVTFEAWDRYERNLLRLQGLHNEITSRSRLIGSVAQTLGRLESGTHFSQTGTDESDAPAPGRPRNIGDLSPDIAGITVPGLPESTAQFIAAQVQVEADALEERRANWEIFNDAHSTITDSIVESLERQSEAISKVSNNTVADESARRQGMLSTAQTIGGVSASIASNFIEGQRPMAAFQAAMQLGFGIAALVLNPAAAPLHFASAAQFGVAAAFGPGGGGGGSGSRRPAARAPGAVPATQFGNGGTGAQDSGTTINVMISGSYYSTRDETRRELVQLVDEAGRLGEIRRAP